MALSASASSTSRFATDPTLGKTPLTASPAPQPHTTTCVRKSSASGLRNISSGWSGLTVIALSPSKATNTRPAPACSAALAASRAAPAMWLLCLDSPPKMATSPKLPLWLRCILCCRTQPSAPDSLALGGSVAVRSTPRSSNHTWPALSRPSPVNNPGFRVNKARVNRAPDQ